MSQPIKELNQMEAIVFVILVIGLFVLFKVRLEQHKEQNRK